MESLRDIGNSVIVVEHDRDMIERADHVIDIGPKAGKHGGEIISEGRPDELKNHATLTADYITGKKDIPCAQEYEEKVMENPYVLKAVPVTISKNISVVFPLAKMIGVTGVSGSGKSTLVNETLYPIMNAHYFNGVKKPMPYKKDQWA